VLDDVTDIILNLKQLVVVMHGDEPRFLHLSVEKEGPITAADIDQISDVEIINKDLVICTATEKVKVEMDILVGHGRGYVPAENHNLDDFDIGLIPVDSNFSPVRQVSYVVENTRVAQRTDYDRLVLNIATSGSVTPRTRSVSRRRSSRITWCFLSTSTKNRWRRRSTRSTRKSKS